MHIRNFWGKKRFFGGWNRNFGSFLPIFHGILAENRNFGQHLGWQVTHMLWGSPYTNCRRSSPAFHQTPFREKLAMACESQSKTPEESFLLNYVTPKSLSHHFPQPSHSGNFGPRYTFVFLESITMIQ